MGESMTTDKNNKRRPKTFAQLTSSPPERFETVERPYLLQDVLRLRGSLQVRYTFAERGANRLWELLHSEPYIPCLGALTGNQAMQMVRAGLKAIYLSGWQVAADANTAGQVYPDQSLYPANAGPELCRSAGPRRPDRACGGRRQARLVCADRGRCRGRFRRTA